MYITLYIWYTSIYRMHIFISWDTWIYNRIYAYIHVNIYEYHRNIHIYKTSIPTEIWSKPHQIFFKWAQILYLASQKYFQAIATTPIRFNITFGFQFSNLHTSIVEFLNVSTHCEQCFSKQNGYTQLCYCWISRQSGTGGRAK